MRPRRPNLLPAAFFQKVHYSEDLPASAPVDLHAFGSNYRDLTQENVDPVIEKEIEKFMTKFRAEEESYVDQNLRENPIIWFSEKSTTSCRSSNSTNEQQTPNCTRCKMLAKIKKAKFKLRYKFMTTKLEHHAITLQSLRNFIASAEGKLRMRGRTEQDLQELRDALGIDRHRVENLTEINRQFFKSAEKAAE
ncbi:protein sisterless A-like [Episyrphus balteatus]|uniref:protein sisterless A-like n=1 Tax=Episyrphus balteatus TaxID=286459 RepID=UPI0024863928|nr:protein sisterless A-like [Episyrphus balteatus]